MKAIAVIPGKSGSVHLAEMPRPSVNEIANGRGVLVKVLRVGVDGTLPLPKASSAIRFASGRRWTHSRQ